MSSQPEKVRHRSWRAPRFCEYGTTYGDALRFVKASKQRDVAVLVEGGSCSMIFLPRSTALRSLANEAAGLSMPSERILSEPMPGRVWLGTTLRTPVKFLFDRKVVATARAAAAAEGR